VDLKGRLSEYKKRKLGEPLDSSSNMMEIYDSKNPKTFTNQMAHIPMIKHAPRVLGEKVRPDLSLEELTKN